MEINVIKYVTPHGVNGLLLPTYVVMPTEEEAYENRLRDILNLGVEEVEDLRVETKNCVVDYETSFVSFPQFGIKRHVTAILRNSTLGKIVSKVKFNISKYLEG